jgi:hypothetical protein
MRRSRSRRDITGITLNRQGYAYVNPQPGFFC